MNTRYKIRRTIFYTALTLFVAAVLLLLSRPWRQDRLLGPDDIKNEPYRGISKTNGRAKPGVSPSSPVISEGDNLSKSPSLSPDIKKKVDYKKLKASIEKELEKFPGNAGVVFYDFETGKKIEIEPDEVFESASLVKVPIMLEIYRQAAKGKITMDREMELKDSHKVGGSGVLKDEPSGTRWKVSKLIELMITRSDNTATDMLIELAGMENVEKTTGTLGMKNTTLRRKIYDFDRIDRGKDNLTTPRDMYVIFRDLCEGSIMEKKLGIRESARKEMLEILTSQKNDSMIPRLLPKNVVCAHKTGGLSGIVHDCGVVFSAGRKHYVLVLLSKNVTDESLAEKIFARVSKMLFDV